MNDADLERPIIPAGRHLNVRHASNALPATQAAGQREGWFGRVWVHPIAVEIVSGRGTPFLV